MAFNKVNQDKIQYYKNNRDLCFNEYITKNRSTYELAAEWGLSKSTVYNIMKYHGLIGNAVKDTKTTSDEDKFNVENPIFCYLAGLISADGYISDQYHRVQIELVVECKDILDKLATYFNVSNGVKVYDRKCGFADSREMADLTISSRKLLDELAKLNVSGVKKNNNLRVPNFDNMTDECQEMFIRGLWDGDGYGTRYSQNGYRVSLFTPSKETAEALHKFFTQKFDIRINDIRPRVYADRITGYDMDICANSKVIVKWMYRHNMEYKIDYKYNRYE